MSHSEEGSSSSSGKRDQEKRYKGVRRRKWGKWVSEIRVPGTRERLWLGSYSTPEAAAIAHDTALFSLRGLSVADHLNFPMCLPPFLRTDMSPRSIQKVASEAGMAIDAELKAKAKENNVKVIESEGTQGGLDSQVWEDEDDYSPGMNGESGSELKDEEAVSISIDDMEIYLS